MFLEVLYELRKRRVPVGTQEAVALARALAADLHESSLDGFYHVARAGLEALDLEEVLRRFEERLKEQKERHDGGNHWIGTGGTSPFGRGGEHPQGIQVGPEGGGRGGAIKTADARKYKPYRSDVTLDIRQ